MALRQVAVYSDCPEYHRVTFDGEDVVRVEVCQTLWSRRYATDAAQPPEQLTAVLAEARALALDMDRLAAAGVGSVRH